MRQQQMTPSSSPARVVSDQGGCCPGSINTQEAHQQQPEKHDQQPREVNRPAEPPSLDGQVALAVAQLEELSLDLTSFTQGAGDVAAAVVVEAGSCDEDRDNASAEQPVSPFEDPEGGSQTSSEESWASFPSSTSSYSSADSSDDSSEGDAPGPAPKSPAATFKFHEELDNDGDVDVDDDYYYHNDRPEPAAVAAVAAVAAPAEPFKEEDPPYPVYPGEPWSRPIPRWAFIQSSHTLPVHGLGPEDFYHGGSGLRHEVSADEEDEDPDEDSESRWSQEISTVGVVYL
ncbi:hypothetical protein diail_9629 [Diaporthe ilicicola]|nr:hypothetical protein diail_9629 [Diaporthe ilicicola]